MRKRRMYIAAIILLILTIAGVGGFYVFNLYNSTVKDLHEKAIEQEEEIILLDEDIAYYESLMTDTFCFNKEMQAGSVITGDDIETRQSTVDTTPLDIFTNIDDIIGKTVKVSCTEGTIISQSIVLDIPLKANERELDIVLDEVPIALEEGDFVDIRISFPLGQDYIALSHKKVIGVYDNVLKIIIDQKDIYTYEAMKTDASIYIATKLYAIKYIEPGVQTAAITYYPVSREIMKTMLLDENIDTADYSKILESRLQLETILNESDKVEKRRTVTSDKTALIQEFKSAQSSYSRLQAKKTAQEANGGKQ